MIIDKKEAIKYGKYLSSNPYKFLNYCIPKELKWYQKLYFKVLNMFSKKKKVVITTDDGFIVTFKNGSIISSIKSDRNIRSKRVDSRYAMYDWERIQDKELVNEVLKKFIKR